MSSTELSLGRRISDVVAEYETKLSNIPNTAAEFESAGNNLRTQVSVGGTFGRTSIDTGRIYESTLKANLLKSAWYNIYDGLQIKYIATAEDKRLFERHMENPPEFTIENIKATFGQYILDPRSNILRGLAEVFCGLDSYYKSHEKMKIGVKGLPKRVIISGVNDYGYGWGKDKIEDVLNALARIQGKPMIDYAEIQALLKSEDALLKPWTHDNKRYPARGVRLRRFQNGNGHLFFEPDELVDINRALAEYYGEVLADCPEARPNKKQESTAVSKDLQYYPTPQQIVDRILSSTHNLKGLKVLEPSCGCGRFMDAIRAAGGEVFGVEVDAGRVEECREKGHNVLRANFLDTPPREEFDCVIMNPPFYGKHYAKHVNHALKFIKAGGFLVAILPATARYDHGLLDGQWQDLPFGSFSESGTNINTTVLTIRR